jgi:hypothetical protein
MEVCSRLYNYAFPNCKRRGHLLDVDCQDHAHGLRRELQRRLYIYIFSPPTPTTPNIQRMHLLIRSSACLERNVLAFCGVGVWRCMPCVDLSVCNRYSYTHTNQRKAIIATLPLLRVHLMNHRQSPSLARNNSINTLQQPKLFRGHTHACSEPRPTGICKHPQAHTVHQEVTPTHPNADLPQSACNKGRSRDTTRAGRFISKRM